MAEGEIKPDLVEKTITEGETWQDGGYDHYNSLGDFDFMWGTLDKTGRVDFVGK